MVVSAFHGPEHLGQRLLKHLEPFLFVHRIPPRLFLTERTTKTRTVTCPILVSL